MSQPRVLEMNDADISTLVRNTIAEKLEVDPGTLTDSTRFVEDLDADSLYMVEILMELEHELGVTIPPDVLPTLKTVGDAIRYVCTRREARS